MEETVNVEETQEILRSGQPTLEIYDPNVHDNLKSKYKIQVMAKYTYNKWEPAGRDS